MFSFFAKHTSKLPEPNTQNQAKPAGQALAALLVEAACADNLYSLDERMQILRILQVQMSIDKDLAEKWLQAGEALADKSHDAYQFTKTLKKWPEDRRIGIIEALWEVVLSDEHKCAFEDAYIRHVASLLHIDDRQRTQARMRVEANMHKKIN